MTNKTCELLLTLLSFAILCAVVAQSDSSRRACNATRLIYSKIAGSVPHDFHHTSQDDGTLKVCKKQNTCCTHSMELTLAKSSDKLRAMVSGGSDQIIRKAFDLTARKFQGFFASLIRNSYQSLDGMFFKTYGSNYEDHKQVFVSLFTSLEKYMNGTELDLKQLMDNFFALLYQKVYVLFNDEYLFDRRYENCILESAESVRPFGDGPRKIAVQISRSLLASRVFLEGLKAGFSVVDELLRLEVRKECEQAFMRMSYCGICQGAIGVKPCYKFCLNVMKGCFAYRSVVNTYWNDYISAMLKLGAKLEGPFSMEAIVEPLGVKISEAIMVFQDMKSNITTKVQQLCGFAPRKPISMPMRRQGVRSRRSSGLSGSFPFDLLGLGKGPKPTTAAGTNLDRLVHEVKNSLGPLRDHWIQMAYSICLRSISDGPNVTTGCWNGHDTSGYKLPVAQDGIPGMFRNPEVPLNMSVPEMTVQTQVIRLKETTQRILNAVHGADSNTIDTEEGSGDSGDGSGEGSGGSAQPPTDQPNTIPSSILPTTEGNTVEEINPRDPNGQNNVERDPFNIYQQQQASRKTGDNAGSRIDLSMWLCGVVLLVMLYR